MEENKTKVNPTESYLLKRVKELEKENKKLKADLEEVNGDYAQVCHYHHELSKVCKELAQHFEIRTDESETFDFSYFDGSFFTTLWKDNEKNSSGEQHLIDFLNYVKENLWTKKN